MKSFLAKEAVARMKLRIMFLKYVYVGFFLKFLEKKYKKTV